MMPSSSPMMDADVQMVSNPMAMREDEETGVKKVSSPETVVTDGQDDETLGNTTTQEVSSSELENPQACTRCVFCLLRFLTIPSTPVPLGAERSTCCSARTRRTAEVEVAGGTSGTVDTEGKKYANKSRIIAGRYLISLFVLDYGAAAVGKIMHFDILDMCSSLGMHIVLVDIAMTTIESCAEFVGTSITPFVFRLIYPREAIESRLLAHFAMRIYTVSNFIAFLVYPVISGVAWFGCNINLLMIIILIAFRTLQYSIINQVGDAAIQMAKPHWLRTFEGTSMQIPGFDLGGCYIRTSTTEDTLSAHIALIALFFVPLPTAIYFFVKDHAVGRLVMATVVALLVATVSLMFWLRDSVLTAGVQVEDVTHDRRTMSISSSADISDGVVREIDSQNPRSKKDAEEIQNAGKLEITTGDSKCEDAEAVKTRRGCIQQCQHLCGYGNRGIIWISNLKLFEVAIIVLYVLVKVINEQLINCVVAVVLVTMGSTLFTNTFIGGGGLLGLLYLASKIYSENRKLDDSVRQRKLRASGAHSYSYRHRLNRWLRALLMILVFVVASGLLLLLRPPIEIAPEIQSGTNETALLKNATQISSSCEVVKNNYDSYEEDIGSTRSLMTIFGILLVLPLYPAVKMFDVEYDSFLMDYERSEPTAVTSMQFWTSILSPVGHIIMLLMNYLMLTNSEVLSSDVTDVTTVAESGTIQVAIVMIVSVSVQILLWLYYNILDRMMPGSCSVRKNLMRLDKLRGEIQKDDGGVDPIDDDLAFGEINRRATITTSQRVNY